MIVLYIYSSFHERKVGAMTDGLSAGEERELIGLLGKAKRPFGARLLEALARVTPVHIMGMLVFSGDLSSVWLQYDPSSDGLRYPATLLQVGESPDEAIGRLIREQIGQGVRYYHVLDGQADYGNVSGFLQVYAGYFVGDAPGTGNWYAVASLRGSAEFPAAQLEVVFETLRTLQIE